MKAAGSLAYLVPSIGRFRRGRVTANGVPMTGGNNRLSLALTGLKRQDPLVFNATSRLHESVRIGQHQSGKSINFVTGAFLSDQSGNDASRRVVAELRSGCGGKRHHDPRLEYGTADYDLRRVIHPRPRFSRRPASRPRPDQLGAKIPGCLVIHLSFRRHRSVTSRRVIRASYRVPIRQQAIGDEWLRECGCLPAASARYCVHGL